MSGFRQPDAKLSTWPHMDSQQFLVSQLWAVKKMFCSTLRIFLGSHSQRGFGPTFCSVLCAASYQVPMQLGLSARR